MKITVRDYEPKKDKPFLIKKGVAKVALIGSYQHYNNAKVHISKDTLIVEPYCGELGLQYSFISVSGFQDGEAKLFTLSEIKEIEKICKKCLKSLIKNLPK